MIISYSLETRKEIQKRKEILSSITNKTYKDFTPFDWSKDLIDKSLIRLFVEMGKRTKIQKIDSLESLKEFTETIESFEVLKVHNGKLYLIRTNLNKYIKSINVSGSRFSILKLKSLFENDFRIIDSVDDLN